MTRVRIRAFGGFEVWHEDEQLRGFESQKVRALFAYLALRRGRRAPREHLAGLLWPDRDPSSASASLRQALYNLRKVWRGAGTDVPLLESDSFEAALDAELEVWIDVEAFEELLRSGRSPTGIDAHQLAAAVQLYRGEFLAGLSLSDCPEFEDWSLLEGERLRERVVEALRELIDFETARGEFRFAARYARQLLAIDPLSEQAHRTLMRLDHLSGRRNRAIAGFLELEARLREELGVEPMPETRALYQQILEPQAPTEDRASSGPLVPFVGRSRPLAELTDDWEAILEGRPRATWVLGAEGVGKTRLVRTFLGNVTSRRRALVAKGGGYDLAPTVPFGAFGAVLRSLVAEEKERVRASAADLDPAQRSFLARLEPSLGGPVEERRIGLESACHALATVVRAVGSDPEGDPVVLFLENLQWVDPESLAVLRALVEKLDTGRVWVVGTFQSRPEGLPDGGRTVRLDRLEREDLGEIALSLTSGGESAPLEGLLESWTLGLPLAVAELLDDLWDSGELDSDQPGVWQLTDLFAPEDLPPPGDVAGLIERRFRRLPSSARRLAALAAVSGHSFDAEGLAEAAEEHPRVVEVGLELMIERWLVRRFAGYWIDGRRERDLVLWSRGLRSGGFEFAHESIRRTIYGSVSPLRIRLMHREVASSLERAGGEAAQVAHHLVAAGEWARAAAPLVEAIRDAEALGAEPTVRRLVGRLRAVVEKLGPEGGAVSAEARRLLAAVDSDPATVAADQPSASAASRRQRDGGSPK